MKTVRKTIRQQLFVGLVAAVAVTTAMATGLRAGHAINTPPPAVASLPHSKPHAQLTGPQPHFGGHGGVLQFLPGILTIPSGEGDSYNEGGQATDAEVGEPYGVAIDAAGNVYFADSYFSTIRRIDASTGIITTIAGMSPDDGGDGFGIRAVQPGQNARQRALARAQALKARGPRANAHRARPHDAATSVSLEYPIGVALDTQGNVYFSDNDACVVYKVATDGNLTLVAGVQDNCDYGGDGGPATSAFLQYPEGIRIDAAGNIYIADSGNGVIRKVDTSGNITTVAGDPEADSAGDGGPADEAQLSYPEDIELDGTGGYFIADSDANVVRKVDGSGIISTIAGDGSANNSGDGGSATNAELNGPNGVALDASGSLYISEYSGHEVRRIDASGIIGTVAGNGVSGRFRGENGAATSASIGPLNSVAVDASGSIYTTLDQHAYLAKVGPSGIVDFGTMSLSSISSTQTLTLRNAGVGPLTFSGSPSLDNSTNFSVAPDEIGGCNFSQPLASGQICKLFVTFTPTTASTFSATLTFTDDAANVTQSVILRGTATSPPTVTTLEASASEITAGQSLTVTATVTGTPGGATPTGSVDLENEGDFVQSSAVDANGSVTFTLPSLTPGFYAFTANYEGDAGYSGSNSNEVDVVVDAPVATVTLSATPTTVTSGGTIHATATISSMGVVAPTGNVAFVMGGVTVASVPVTAGSVSADFSPTRIGIAGVQAVYLGDSNYAAAYSNTQQITVHAGVLQFTPGLTTLFAGVPTDDNHGGYSGDGGPAKQARMHFPAGVAVDSVGNVYVADQSNGEIRKIDAVTGKISQYAGVPHTQSIYFCNYSGDGGDANNAYLCNPSGMVFDSNNNLYFADYGNDVVRRIDATTHIITRVAGVQGNGGYNGDGLATSSYLDNPQAIAFDSQGNMYIADTNNKLVRKVDTSGNLTTVAGRYGYSPSNPVNGTPATSNTLREPEGIAVDSHDNFYVSDGSDQAIFKIDTNGILTTYAGGGTNYSAPYGDGDLATKATLDFPEELAFDPSDNLFIADNGHYTVRRVDKSTGIISLYAGIEGAYQNAYNTDPSGNPSTDISILNPYGLAFDNNGALYVTDVYVNVVLKFGPQGNMLFPAAGGTPEILTLTNAGDSSMTFSATPYTTTGTVSVSAAPSNSCNFTQPLAAGATCYVSVSVQDGGHGIISFSDTGVSSPQIVTVGVNPNPGQSTTEVSIYGSPADPGGELDFIASISGSGLPPSGTVSFFEGTTLLGSAPVTQGFGYISVTTLTPGDHSIVAVYSGDLNYSSSASDPMIATVKGKEPTLTLSATPGTVNVGDTITATLAASGTGATPTGTVQFVMGGVVVGTATLSNGSASATFTATRTGTAGIQARYSGDATYTPSVSNTVQVMVHGGLLQFTPASVSRIAGVPTAINGGAYSGDGGLAAGGYLNTPTGVAQDSVGNVYIADQKNNVVRRVDAVTGIITTYAGVQYTRTLYTSCNDTPGDGAAATSASLCDPTGVALDPNDNLYIADYSHQVVRKVDATTGIITTVAGVMNTSGFNGDGVATATQLFHPQALTFDAAGDFYIADHDNRLVRKVDTNGNLTTVAGCQTCSGASEDNVPATQAGLQQPEGMSVDASGNLYIADPESNVIVKVNMAGTMTVVAGSTTSAGSSGDGGPARSALLLGPTDVKVDSLGNLFIYDAGNQAIRRVDALTGNIDLYAGIEGQTYGSDSTDPSGKPATDFTLNPGGLAQLALDGKGGVYATEDGPNTVLKLNGSAGQMLFGTAVNGPVQTLGIRNSGDGAITFSSTAYTVTGGFTITAPQNGGCSFATPLASGAACSLNVQFTGGQPNGALTFTDSALGGTQTVALNVNPAPIPTATTLGVTGSPANAGSPVNFAAQVSGTGLPLSGSVSFYDGTALLGTAALVSGASSLSVSTLSVGQHSITAAYSGDLNFATSVSSAQTVTINAVLQTQSITVGTLPSPNYGNATFAVTATASSGLPVTITILSGPASGVGPFTINGAGTVTLQATQAGNSSYHSAPPVNFSVNIASAVLTVRGSSGTRVFDHPNPALTYTITGFVRGQNISAVNGTATVSTTAVGTSPPGAYAVAVGRGTLSAGANYTFALTNGTLLVTGPVAQSISFGRVPNLPVGTTMTLSARASSGLPVIYSVSGPATVVGNKLTPNGTGQVTVTASQSGNTSYSAATPVPQSFTASQTVTAQ